MTDLYLVVCGNCGGRVFRRTLVDDVRVFDDGETFTDDHIDEHDCTFACRDCKTPVDLDSSPRSRAPEGVEP